MRKTSAQNYRINVVLDPDTHQALCGSAKKAGVSVSFFAQNLIKDALKRQEELSWEALARERERSFVKEQALPHNAVWKTSRISRHTP